LFLSTLRPGGLGWGVSTIGIIYITHLSPPEKATKNLTHFQNALTAGQLLGPPVGTCIASFLGYRAAFAFATMLIFIFLFFLHRYVGDIPLQNRMVPSEAPYRRKIIWGWMLAIIATIQLTFLPSILPGILHNFRLTENEALNFAGIIIMSYTATAMAGTYLFGVFSSAIGLKKAIAIACSSAALLQILLFLGRGVLSFMVIRMIQTGFIAAVFPLTLSIFARSAGGGMIGFLNSARFWGNAAGPMLATFVLAYSNLLTLYLLIALLTGASLAAFLGLGRTKRDLQHFTL
jgi:MFS family permease